MMYASKTLPLFLFVLSLQCLLASVGYAQKRSPAIDPAFPQMVPAETSGIGAAAEPKTEQQPRRPITSGATPESRDAAFRDPFTGNTVAEVALILGKLGAAGAILKSKLGENLTPSERALVDEQERIKAEREAAVRSADDERARLFAHDGTEASRADARSRLDAAKETAAAELNQEIGTHKGKVVEPDSLRLARAKVRNLEQAELLPRSEFERRMSLIDERVERSRVKFHANTDELKLKLKGTNIRTHIGRQIRRLAGLALVVDAAAHIKVWAGMDLDPTLFPLATWSYHNAKRIFSEPNLTPDQVLNAVELPENFETSNQAKSGSSKIDPGPTDDDFKGINFEGLVPEVNPSQGDPSSSNHSPAHTPD